MANPPGKFSRILVAFLAPWMSRKLWMVIFGLAVINSLFWTAVWYLYSFTDAVHVVAFENMFQTAMWTTSAIILGYLGFQSLMTGFTRNTLSATQNIAEQIFSKHEEVLTVRTEGGAKAFMEAME